MDRLTKKYNGKNIVKSGHIAMVFNNETGNRFEGEAIDKLAAYEDAEEQGLLLRLPCKVGDTVYVPTRNFVSELRIILISIERDNIFFHWRLNTGIYPNLDGFTSSYIGKMVFFTCEEAEAKLAEMEGSHAENRSV